MAKSEIAAYLYANSTDPVTFSGRFTEERSFDYVATPKSGKMVVDFVCAPSGKTMGKLTFPIDEHTRTMLQSDGVPDADGKGYRLIATDSEKAPFKLVRRFNQSSDTVSMLSMFE